MKAEVKEAVAEVKEAVVEAVKEEPKKEEVKEIAEAVKETAKEAVAEVKEAAEKVVKKAAAKTTKKVAEKAVMEPEVFVQYEDNGTQEASVADLVAKVKALYVAEGHRESSIKSLQIYMKPQEWAAYYVINKKITGRIDLF
ncbi:MAG: hypothetical protein J6A75_00590 [Lachnospiraceae bacterium]|nr:hypothetical protein [Lachnospiraceae bacterium]